MFTVTTSAAGRIRQLCEKEEYSAFTTPGLRIKVIGGGCAGLSYDMEVVDGPQEGDEVMDIEGARVYVDPRSLPFLEPVTLEWKKTLMASSFEWQNPQATGTCGCGESFSV